MLSTYTIDIIAIFVGLIVILLMFYFWFNGNEEKYKTARTIKWTIIVFESYFSMPVLGHLTYALLYIMLMPVMVTLHVVAFIVSKLTDEPSMPHIIGVITAIIGFIPVIGWLLHITTLVTIFGGLDYNEKANGKMLIRDKNIEAMVKKQREKKLNKNEYKDNL